MMLKNIHIFLLSVQYNTEMQHSHLFLQSLLIAFGRFNNILKHKTYFIRLENKLETCWAGSFEKCLLALPQPLG